MFKVGSRVFVSGHDSCAPTGFGVVTEVVSPARVTVRLLGHTNAFVYFVRNVQSAEEIFLLLAEVG